MAVESIGALVPTKIPGYADAADIQAALRAYHYGSYTFDTSETNPANLINPSIAYTITNLQTQITTLGDDYVDEDVLTAKGSLITASAASTPVELAIGTNGHVLTANSSATYGLEWAVPVVTLTNSATLTNKTLTSPVVTGLTLNDASIIFEGSTANDFETTLTVTDPTADRTITFPDTTGTVALMSQVINNTLTSTTGDIIYASGSNTPARLGIGSEGQVLSVSSGVPAWSTPAAGGGGSASLPDIFLLGGM
jgi:hypothetical protein